MTETQIPFETPLPTNAVAKRMTESRQFFIGMISTALVAAGGLLMLWLMYAIPDSAKRTKESEKVLFDQQQDING